MGVFPEAAEQQLACAFNSTLRDFHGDAGFYGGCSAGDPTIRFLGHPLYITAEAFVRSINKVGIAVVNGSALFAHDIGNGDLLFAFYGDSLSNGKERYWGGSGGQQAAYQFALADRPLTPGFGRFQIKGTSGFSSGYCLFLYRKFRFISHACRGAQRCQNEPAIAEPSVGD